MLNLRDIGGEFGCDTELILRDDNFGEFVRLWSGDDGLYVC